MNELPVLLGSVEVLHKNAFVSGPRITRTDIISYKGSVVAVDFWTNPNGSLVRVDAPRAPRPAPPAGRVGRILQVVLDDDATNRHPVSAMSASNRTTLADAARVINHARAAGFEVKTTSSDIGGYTMHSIPLPRNPYTDSFAHIIVMVTHPRRGGRTSARITTSRHSNRPGARSTDRRGPWDANCAIRDTRKDLYSWSKFIAAISASLESANL